jgi:hypothetical protein
MKHLEYRLRDLDDASTANALFDDLSDAHPDLRALFDALRTRLQTEDVDALHRCIDDLVKEADYREDEIARLTDDLSYQIDRTRSLEIELHDATRGQAK